MTDVWGGGGGLTDLGLGGRDRPLGRGGGGGAKARGAVARPALGKRAARRRVRLSEKARGAAARPAL